MARLIVLVSGSRDWRDEALIEQQLDSALSFSDEHELEFLLVHGDCPTGADKIAADWAAEFGIAVVAVPADWTKFGKSAGFRRNTLMLDTLRRRVSEGDQEVVLCFQQNGSAGTQHVIDGAHMRRLNTRIFRRYSA